MKDKLKYFDYVKKRDYYQGIVSYIASVRLVVFFTMFISFIAKYYYYYFFFSILFFCCLILFILMVIIHDFYYKRYDYYVKSVDIIEEYIARENGKWREFNDNGSDFLDNSPYYYSDLDLFGNGSLFQYLSICKTFGGRECLKKRLSNINFSSSKLLQEQEMISEVSNNFSFLLDFQCLLKDFEDRKVFLSKDFIFSSKKIRYYYLFGTIIISLLSILFFVLSIFRVITFNYFYLVMIFNFFVSDLIYYINKNEFFDLEKLMLDYKCVDSIMKRVILEKFSSVRLKSFQEDFSSALGAGIHLKRLEFFCRFRNNFIANVIFNGLFGINYISLFLFDCFKNRDLSLLNKAVKDVEELEAVGSLAGVGIVFSHKCMPVLSDDVGIHFSHLIHPLLGEKKCVPNQFDSSCGVNIITGSNMGGKTSFLRTIGINMILMNSGSFVCADKFSSSYFKIFTSMRVSDDINSGISTFYGELLRIKDMVNYVDKGNMLVLIDEIFKGTNYQDRIYGAKEVIKQLNTKDTIVLLTTHDFELCDEENVTNYFVQESYVDDKIVFDYKIRSGKCNSTNARYLMKKLGIIKK